MLLMTSSLELLRGTDWHCNISAKLPMNKMAVSKLFLFILLLLLIYFFYLFFYQITFIIIIIINESATEKNDS